MSDAVREYGQHLNFNQFDTQGGGNKTIFLH